MEMHISRPGTHKIVELDFFLCPNITIQIDEKFIRTNTSGF